MSRRCGQNWFSADVPLEITDVGFEDLITA